MRGISPLASLLLFRRNFTRYVTWCACVRVCVCIMQALYDFDGQDADELSFKAGELLIITGELNGWYLGKHHHAICSDHNECFVVTLGRTEKGDKVGIFPSNYVSLKQ